MQRKIYDCRLEIKAYNCVLQTALILRQMFPVYYFSDAPLDKKITIRALFQPVITGGIKTAFIWETMRKVGRKR